VSRPVPNFDVIDDQMAAVLREKTEWERLQIGFEMWHSAQKMIWAIVTAEHPEWTAKLGLSAEWQTVLARETPD
jgi:hypothetical protein